MNNNDIDINFFSFFAALDKMKSLKSDIIDNFSLFDSIYDDNSVIDSSLLQSSISNYKKIFSSGDNDDSLLNFIVKMEEFKETLLLLEPNFEYYYNLYNNISDDFGEDFFLNDNNVTPDVLDLIYPGFNELSSERKIIIYDAIKYANLSKKDAMRYATGGFTNNYNNSGRYQFPSYDKAWCANFCGGIITYRYGRDNLIGREYQSVYKLVGNYGDQTGIAFSDDGKKQFILSSSSMQILDDSIINDWKNRLDEYNDNTGSDIMVTDWIDEYYNPLAGDLIIFNFNDGEEYKINYPDEPRAYSHVGFVLGTREVNGQILVDTIEGNVKDSVVVRSFSINDPQIKAYCHINYEKYQMISETSEKRILLKSEVDEIAKKGIDYSFNNVDVFDIVD